MAIECEYKTELLAWLRSKKPISVRFNAEWVSPFPSRTRSRCLLIYCCPSDRIIYMKKKGKEQKLQFTQDLDQLRAKLKVEPSAQTFYKKNHVYTVTGLPPNSGSVPAFHTPTDGS